MIIMLRVLCLLLWLIIMFFLIRAQAGRARDERGKVKRASSKRPYKTRYQQNK